MTNSNTIEITTFSLVHGWFYSVKLMYLISQSEKKKIYIVHFNENKMYSWTVRNHQVYTVKSSCLTLVSHAYQVLSDVIISHISTFNSLLSWRWSCLSLCFQSILWKRRGNWPLNWSVFNSFIMLFTIQAFLFLFITNL